jgi:hypothetical protein
MLHLNILHKCKKISKMIDLFILLKKADEENREKQKARRIV